MKKKIFVIAAVVIAVMVLGISSALAFGGPGRDDAQRPNGRSNECDGTCDGTCDGVPLEPKDGTGNRYGHRAGGTVCGGDCDINGDDGSCGNGDCEGTCDGEPLRPQDGTGKRYGMRTGGFNNGGTCDSGSAPPSGNGRQGGRSR